MSHSALGDDSGGLASMLEKMPSMDLVTILVLGLNAYLLYTQLDYYRQNSVFTVSMEPMVLAIQGTVLLIVINGIEFLHDRKSSR